LEDFLVFFRDFSYCCKSLCSFANPDFGVVSGQYNDPRLVQFALRLVF